MPRKLRELLRDYRKAGAIIDFEGGKGSHRKITHPDVKETRILSGPEGADAKHYQEKQLKKFISEINKNKK